MCVCVWLEGLDFHFFCDHTGDMSSSENLCEAQVDERIDAIINTQDPSIVDDLRHHNRGHPTKYEDFWEQCKRFLEDETAADDRRHDQHTHLAKAISVRDLLEQVTQRCPEGCPIPSKQWLRLQFWPKNQTNKAALQYTGRLDVKFMIQVRQLRKSHEDSHYCAAMFKYLREFVVRFHQHAALLCLDDKHRCKVGEPGLPVAAVERGKSVVVTTSGKRFSVADHDFTKFSIIPSVVLLCDVPDDAEKSFYRGQVYVGIKDSALEPSSALRHSTELSKILLQNQISSPILVLFTDGGPDHNNTFLSVKLGLIALFLQLDLDMLEAVRIAPYQSWKNPCERVHSNLGLQATGLMRTAMELRFESAISKCSSVKDVRDAVKETPGLEEALKDSVEPVKTLLHSVFSRLNLKDKPISSCMSASQHEIDAFFSILQDIEPEITQSDRKANVLAKRPALSAFMKHCCYERKYLFGIKKCGKLDCRTCKAPRLAENVFKDLHHIPDPVPDTSLKYKSFDELYGTITTEQYRPSKSKAIASTHGIPFSPNAQTARELVCCTECLKPRVIYSQRKLTFAETSVLFRSLESLLYSCGSTLKGVEVECRDGEDLSLLTLFERLFVRQNLSCDDPVEVPYYSSDRFEDICAHCGCVCAESESGQYPLCSHCKHEGKHPVLKRKRKMVQK